MSECVSGKQSDNVVRKARVGLKASTANRLLRVHKTKVSGWSVGQDEWILDRRVKEHLIE